MAPFTAHRETAYAPSHMPQPAYGSGPWGEAIRYWLNDRKLRQADLLRKVQELEAAEPPEKLGKKTRKRIRPNTISRATRGFHTTTRVLEKIARALDVTLDAVLVSPARRLADEEQRRMAVDVVEEFFKKVDTRSHGRRDQAADQAARIASRIMRLSPEARAEYEASLSDDEYYAPKSHAVSKSASAKPTKRRLK